MMPSCCFDSCGKITSPRSGCRVRRIEICGNCCGTGIRRLPGLWIHSGRFHSRSKLPEMMVHVEICVPHAFYPAHLTESCMSAELALRATEAIQENAEILHVGSKLGRRCTPLVLIHLRPCFNSTRPTKWKPKRSPFIDSALVECGGLSNLFFSQRRSKRIA